MKIKTYHIVTVAVLLLYAVHANAQNFLAVTAKDGYANICDWNLKKTGRTLKTGTVVFWDDEYDGPGHLNGWYKIAYTKDAFSKNAEEAGGHLQDGLIHKSQVANLFVISPADENSFSMKYETKKFSFNNKRIVYGEGNNYIEKVNDHNLFGADCGLPKTEIVKATARFYDKTVEIPKYLLWNLLSAKDGFQYYYHGDTYYAYQQNGDGGCAYYVIWAFRNGKLVQRLIGNLY